ncbi:RNA polymerase sigma factor [Nocardioides sp.]|uniref:RNA polymerase sigma factor n=1 Tax=Nocardioides sp. TaxID=35761 RepID=UPI0019C5EEAB|nr:RNA polymerase sigma factor [Nocardioides sp.]MBC7274979.1 RNA polymerase sigma factor [Nocardioides sp.]
MSDATRAVEAIWRIESARIVGALARYTGDFALAEDAAQEALAEALVSWPRDGQPANPVGWLMTTAKRRAIDTIRRAGVQREKYESIAHDQDETYADDLDIERIDDDVLALMFISCHPVLSKEARVALTLRVVGGLSSEEIARAFLVPVPTIQARITRAKKTIAAAKVPFEAPSPEERRQRLPGVLNVLYLIFTEGSTATSGEELIRTDLAREARRLTRVLIGVLPDEPEAYGLLALMELTASRFPARTDSNGDAILLEDQDRTRWDRGSIRRGLAALEQATPRGLGPYGLQAAIAGTHAVADSVATTDWERIIVLYEALGRIAPNPIVDLNRAVAVAMAHGPMPALELVDRIADPITGAGRLDHTHLLPTVRGELLRRLGRTVEAREELERAAEMCTNERERAVLQQKVADLP